MVRCEHITNFRPTFLLIFLGRNVFRLDRKKVIVFIGLNLDQKKIVIVSWSSSKMKLDQEKLAPVTASRSSNSFQCTVVGDVQ